jgi:hypothetical protein
MMDAGLRFDKFCTWPCREEQVWQLMLSLNKRRVATKYKRRPSDKCFTFSHFLPHTGLPFSRGIPELAKAMGCKVFRSPGCLINDREDLCVSLVDER